jgi:hypothetical protein
MNHQAMIKFYQRRKRRRLNRLGWITLWLAVCTIMATIAITILLQ